MRKYTRKLTVAASLLIAFSAGADVIHLNDGTTVNGELKKAADGWFVTDAKGKTTHISADEVKSIELSPRGDPKDVAVGRLASLRRSVEALGDLKVIIDRYEKFIEQNKEFGAAKDAEKDLALWKDRLEKGMVKVGNKWVAPGERAGLAEKALLSADMARELLKQNKFKEAEAAVNKALNDDPTNVSAMYLKGLILYRQDQIQPARKVFEAVKEASPDHGPTLNNLAVIMWRQNQQLAALNVYDQAMIAMPLNKELLNNVAEALNGLTEEQRKSPIAQKVSKRWTEQDTQLQQQMMQVGWYRWGATWVDKSQYAKLQAAEKEVKDKIAKLEGDFAEAQARIDSIDGQITANRDAMRYMEQSRFYTDATGRVIANPLPPQYWDYDRANRRLEVQRKESVALLDALRAKAQAVAAQVPIPKYTGVQLMVGVEGTPAVAVAPAGGADKPVAPVNLKDELIGAGEQKAEEGGAPAKAGEVKPGETKAGEAKPGLTPVAGDRPLKY